MTQNLISISMAAKPLSHFKQVYYPQCRYPGIRTQVLTFKDGADLPPSCDASLASVLAQRCLQKEDRNATGEKEDEVGDEKSTCGWETGCPLPSTSLLMVHIHLFQFPPHTAHQNPRVGGHETLQGASVQVSGTIAEIQSHQVIQNLISPFFSL